jgi:hypothetical protein
MGFDSKLSVLYFNVKIDISTRLYHVTQGLKVKRQHVVLRAFSHFYAVHDKQQVPTNFNAKRLMLDESVATSAYLSIQAFTFMFQFYSDPQTGVPSGKTRRCNVRSKI